MTSLDNLALDLSDKILRMNVLYKIIDKNAHLIEFSPNWMQRELFSCDHPRIINLKARQLGSTTYFALSVLDDALFNSNQNICITSLSQESGEKIFNRIIKNAYNNLHPSIKKMNPIIRERTKGLVFKNGSEIIVDTTARSGTITHLLCTEFGKVCARYPQKAEEIITGSINAVPKGAKVIIESTAEGSSGYFYDLCQKAMKLNAAKLAESQYRFFFFPWWREPTYTETDTNILVSNRLKTYFDDLEKLHGIKLTQDQKRFYTIKYFENEEKVKQEYPSLSSEAFLASSEGFWYQKHLYELRKNGRICTLHYDKLINVNTGWDLGRYDATAIWFFQILPNGNIHYIDYYENSGEGFEHYAKVLQTKGYVYGNHFVPHDAASRDKNRNESYVDVARELGFNLEVMPRKNPILGINNVRISLERTYFDEKKCELGVLMLEGYKKKWNERMQSYSSDDVHDKYSHGADAIRCAVDGINWLKYGNDYTEQEIEEIRGYELREQLKSY